MILLNDMFRTTNPYDELISRSPSLSPTWRRRESEAGTTELTPLPSPSSFPPLLPLSPLHCSPAVKATDEKLTSEDWGLNLELCDKVTEDKEAGSVRISSTPYRSLHPIWPLVGSAQLSFRLDRDLVNPLFR